MPGIEQLLNLAGRFLGVKTHNGRTIGFRREYHESTVVETCSKLLNQALRLCRDFVQSDAFQIGERCRELVQLTESGTGIFEFLGGSIVLVDEVRKAFLDHPTYIGRLDPI